MKRCLLYLVCIGLGFTISILFQVARTTERTTTMAKHSIVDAKNVLAIGVKCHAMTRIVAVSMVSDMCFICSVVGYKTLILARYSIYLLVRTLS